MDWPTEGQGAGSFIGLKRKTMYNFFISRQAFSVQFSIIFCNFMNYRKSNALNYRPLITQQLLTDKYLVITGNYCVMTSELKRIDH